MRNGSISLGRILGIPVLLHWSVVLIAALVASSAAGAYGWPLALVAVTGFLVSILLHELAHAVVARRHGVSTESIQLWALGGVARLDREAATARGEAQIAVAGPLTSLILGALALGSAVVLGGSGVSGSPIQALAWLGTINLVLGVFNLLPGAPLDGGRILRAMRWRRHGDRLRATREAGTAGQAVGWSLAGIGMVMIFNGLPGLMVVLTGAFIAVSARAERATADLAERVRGIRVGDLTWFGVAHASPDTDADTMWWQRRRLGGAGVVAIERPDGGLAGLVSEEQLQALPDERRRDVTLGSLMVSFSDVARAEPDEDLSAVVTRLNPRTPVITVWHGDRLLGVIPRRRLLGRLGLPVG